MAVHLVVSRIGSHARSTLPPPCPACHQYHLGLGASTDLPDLILSDIERFLPLLCQRRRLHWQGLHARYHHVQAAIRYLDVCYCFIEFTLTSLTDIFVLRSSNSFLSSLTVRS